MKPNITKPLIILAFCCLYFSGLSQAKVGYIKQTAVTYYGNTDTSDYLPIIINSNNNVIVAGNKKISATQYDATMAEQTSAALTVWNTSFNSGNQKSFVLASATDSGGNIITVGGIRTSTTNALDMLVIKQDPLGNIIWVYTYNGPGNYNDCATAVALDPSDNIYITGGSDGTGFCLTDYATIMLDQSGNQIWCTRYNYTNSFDFATSIQYIASAGHVVVSGSSGNNFGNYEVATVVYDATSGTQKTVDRLTSTTAGQDKPLGMVTDSLGFTYIAGTSFNGSNYDAYVMKLDTALNTVWQNTINIHGFDDAAFGVDIDDSLNVYVTGSSNLSSTTKELFVVKYHTNGTFAWANSTKGLNAVDAEGLRIICKNYSEIFVGGNVSKNNNQDAALFRFNEKGEINLTTNYNGVLNGRDQFMDMEISGNMVYLSARTATTGGLDANVVVSYKYMDRENIANTNTTTSISYVENEAIIGFRYDRLKHTAINDVKKTFGDLNEFVNDSTVDEIVSQLDPEQLLKIKASDFKAIKIFPSMTENDTVSESRMGDYVRVPAFYSYLLVQLPTTLNTTNALSTIRSLNSHVYAGQLNYLYQPLAWAPNDSFYTVDQASLHSTILYANAHIACDSAWDVSKGESFVRVGVYDTGIDDSHPDMGNVAYNYMAYGTSWMNTTDKWGHGTQVAGIIAAKSNNTIGVTGIAGGDVASNKQGVSLYNYKVIEVGSASLPTYKMMQMYVMGASGTNMNGQAVHIMNHSYGAPGLAIDSAIMAGIDYCNKNGVAFVAARGNKKFGDPISINEWSSPATMRPHKVMNVGASGVSGHYHTLFNGNDGSYASLIGRKLDFVAPGDNYLTMAIKSTQIVTNFTAQAVAPTYTPFSGTSSSAPHVSGVIALMMSARNQSTANWDNIVHEDCEALIKRTATDLDFVPIYNESVGYDTLTGYGRINAKRALDAVEAHYHIYHIDKNHFSTGVTTTTALVGSGIKYWPGHGAFGPMSGNYSTDVVKITTVYSYSFPGDIKISAWPLYKASIGTTPQTSNVLTSDENGFVDTVAVSINGATLTTYAYKLLYLQGSPTVAVNYWFPAPPSNINSAISLYTYNAILGVKEQSAPNVEYVNLYPNPNTGNFTLGFNAKKSGTATIKINDFTGRLIYESEKTVEYGVNRYPLTFTNLPKGVYFVTLDMDSNRTLTKKVIIE